MTSLCKTCMNFMLVKITSPTRQNDIIRHKCLVSKSMIEHLKVCHFKDDKGIGTDYPNVVFCTHYNEDKRYCRKNKNDK